MTDVRSHASSEIIMLQTLCYILVITFGLILPLTPSTAIGADSLPTWTEVDVPRSAKELWQDYDPRREPLDVKILRSWQQNDVHVHYVIYTVGTFRGKLSTMAAFYTTPLKTDQQYPAVVNIHGGGQRAYLRGSIEYAQRGYC